jgi:predicted nuclease of restriction endonuclease-like (RecB) superfamily
MSAFASIREEEIADMPGRRKRAVVRSKSGSQGASRRRGLHPLPAGHEPIRQSTQQDDDLPSDYARVLKNIKVRVQRERLQVVLAANAAMVQLYWDIGNMILGRQNEAGWGAKIIDRLSADLRDAYPEMQGFSPRNLLFMRSFAATYPDPQIVKQLVSQLPWGHIVRLMQRVKDGDARQWYMREAIRHGWSRSVLEVQIDGNAHRRTGRTQNNFEATLPPADSDLAGQVFKDPYLFDFLGTADPRREREVEQALVDHIQRFLLELGTGFALVGRQVHLEVGNEDFYIDLLFYHLKLRRYIVIELKATAFDPGFVGQLNLYLSAVDDLLRHPDDRPTIGLLLCQSKNKIVVEYALRHLQRPIGVAEWETRLVEQLPDELKGSLPSIEEIEAELELAAER